MINKYYKPRPTKPSWSCSAADEIKRYIQSNGMSAKQRHRPSMPAADAMPPSTPKEYYRRHNAIRNNNFFVNSQGNFYKSHEEKSFGQPQAYPSYNIPKSQDIFAMDSDENQNIQQSNLEISPELSEEDQINKAIEGFSGQGQNLHPKPPPYAEFYGSNAQNLPEPEFEPLFSQDNIQQESPCGFTEAAITPDNGGVVDSAESSIPSPAQPQPSLEEIVQQEQPDPMMEMADPMQMPLMQGPS